MLKNAPDLLKNEFYRTNYGLRGYIWWKVIVGVQGKLRIF